MNNSTHTQTLKNLVKSLQKSWLFFVSILVALLLVFGLGAYKYSTHQNNTVTYKANSKILLSPNKKRNLDGGNLQVYLNTEKSIIASDKFANYLQKKLVKTGALDTKEKLDYQVDNDNGTSIISIHVTNTNKTKARQQANGISKLISKNPMNILQDGTAEVIGRSNVMQVTAARSLKKIMMLTIVIALIISFVLTIIKAYYNPYIYDSTLIQSFLRHAYLYEVKTDSERKDTLEKIIYRWSNAEKIQNQGISIMYVGNIAKIQTNLTSILKTHQLDLPIVEYTDKNVTENSSINGTQKLAVDDLYTSKENMPIVEMIDCSQIANTGNSQFKVLVVNDGNLTKRQLMKIKLELSQNRDTNLYVIYQSEV